MPITRNEFESGQILTQLEKRVITFLEENRTKAFTSNEVMDGINFQTDFSNLVVDAHKIPAKHKTDLSDCPNLSSIFFATKHKVTKMVLPNKIQGIIFTEIIPQLLAEFDSKKLVELGAIVGQKHRIPLYEPLLDSLRKIQWVRLVGIKAISIEKSILVAKENSPNVCVLDPIKLTAHALCVTDCLIHTKSALDSIAVFLTDLLELKQKGGDRDFKKPGFRQSICQKDAFLEHGIKKLEPWFLELQGIRDEWIHRSSIRCAEIIGPTEVGILPIPKKITGHFADQGKLTLSALTKENFWSTKDFVDHHYINLRELFLIVTDRALQIERQGFSEPIIVPADAEKRMSMFPMFVTQMLKLEKIVSEHSIGPINDW